MKEKELHNINKENETLRENYEMSKRDVKILKAEVNMYEKKSKSKQEKETHYNKEFLCEVCAKKFESISN